MASKCEDTPGCRAFFVKDQQYAIERYREIYPVLEAPMTHFTFDTAYIVAHLQNNANEAVKHAIGERLTEAINYPDVCARWNYAQFEKTCAEIAARAALDEVIAIDEAREDDAREARYRRACEALYDPALSEGDRFPDELPEGHCAPWMPF
jgi:hypothetical protein